MLYNLSVLVSLAAVIGVAALTGFMLYTWFRYTDKKKKHEPAAPPPAHAFLAIPERKYIGKRYTGPPATQQTVLEYIIVFRVADGSKRTIVVPYKVWKDVELGKPSELVVRDDSFLDFDHLA